MSQSKKRGQSERSRKTRRKSPSQARSIATVDAILDATALVLTQDGFEAATTNRIAKAAGVSVGSFYQYFPSREAVLSDLVDRQGDRMLGLFMQRLSGVPDAPLEAAIRTVVHAVVGALAEDAALNRVLLENLPLIGRREKLREMERRAAEMIRVYLEVHRDRVRLKNYDVASVLMVHLVDTIVSVFSMHHIDLLTQGALETELSDLLVRYVVRD